MGFLDSVKGAVQKGKEYAAQNPDKVGNAIDKAGDFADSKTGGKYAGHVDKVQDAARKGLGAQSGPTDRRTEDNPAPRTDESPAPRPEDQGGHPQ